MKKGVQKGGDMVNDFKNYVQNMFSSTTSPETTNNEVNESENRTSEEETKPGTSENRTSEEETKPGTSENGTSEEEEETKPGTSENGNENENKQVGGKKNKEKKKSLKLKKKKKKTARKTKSKKNKTKDRKHGSGACQGKLQPEEQQWKPKSGITKYYGQYVTVEGLNGRKEYGKLIRMNGSGDDPRSIVLEGDNGSTSVWINIKSVTHTDERIGEI